MSLEAIHEAQSTILILDTIRQVYHVHVLTTLLIIQLGMQHRLVGWSLQFKVDVGCVVREAVGAPCEFTYR